MAWNSRTSLFDDDMDAGQVDQLPFSGIQLEEVVQTADTVIEIGAPMLCRAKVLNPECKKVQSE